MIKESEHLSQLGKDFIEDYIAHFGVKGMRWGVINKDDASSLKTKFESFSKEQTYGSMNDPEKKIEDQGFFKSLTPSQKKAAAIFGGTVIVAGLAYGTHRYMGNAIKFKDLRDPKDFLDGKDVYDSISGSAKQGLLAYRDKGIELPSGSLVARVSKDIENNIRPGGFYAAHEYHDIESYKGFLGSIGGHTNYFKATKAIKAPSTDQYLRILADSMDDPKILKARSVNVRQLNKLAKPDRDAVLFKLAAEELSNNNFAYSLNASTVDGLLPKRFVERVLSAGYTSVIDYNNTKPSIAQAPMRHLDGRMFKFFSSEELTAEVKQLATLNSDLHLDKIEEFYSSFAHALFIFGKHLGVRMATNKEVEEFIQHYGVKGMRWGVSRSRSAKYADKAEARAARKENRSAKQTRKQAVAKRRLMSDADLDKYVSRLEKEKKLKTLIDEDLSPGKRAAKMLMSDIGKNSIRTAGTGLAIYGVRAALLKKFDPKEAAQHLKPKK